MSIYKEFKVGIAWQGSTKYKGDRMRSVPFSFFAPLAKIPGVRLISLQKGFGEEQLASAKFPVTKIKDPVDEKSGPFMDTAAILQAIDLFVTSDSAIAHLAGALGVPIWMATPFAPDWRWLRDREDSPWYPTMRLFRQHHRCDWEDVFLRIAEALQKLLPPDIAPANGRAESAAEKWHRRGNELMKDEKLEEALACFRNSLTLQPRNVRALHDQGVALARRKERKEAIICFQKVINHDPDSVDALGNLGLAYIHNSEPHRAIPHLTRAIELRPGGADAVNNLGVAWNRCGEPGRAAEYFQKAIEARADYAEAHVNLGRAYWATGRIPQAWQELEWRSKLPNNVPREFARPRWDGGALDGKTILVYAEHSPSDTLQFIRYAKLLKERGATVIAEVPAKLASVIDSCPDVDRAIPSGDPLPAFDVQVPLPSLPALFATDATSIPMQVPYLFADPVPASAWIDKLAEGRTAGIYVPATTSGDELSLHHFDRLSRLDGLTLYSLQKLPAKKPRFLGRPVKDLGLSGESQNAYSDWAAVLSNLDIFLTADAPIAHLAGAMGVRVWLLLEKIPDARWQSSDEVCPWYPTMRVFRKKDGHAWDEILDRIAQELTAALS